jgi:hypothetical protein
MIAQSSQWVGLDSGLICRSSNIAHSTKHGGGRMLVPGCYPALPPLKHLPIPQFEIALTRPPAAHRRFPGMFIKMGKRSAIS